jgi:hypothetical protein
MTTPDERTRALVQTKGVVVVSTCPPESIGGRAAVTVERPETFAVQLRAMDEDEHRPRFAFVLESGTAGGWLGQQRGRRPRCKSSI